MKNVYPKLLFFFLPFISGAQLHIQKNNTSGSTDNVYIYNKGEILYVQQDISLKDGSAESTSGNIYLRDEGQLIQGDDANSNSGKGIVSVYQEGNVNQWDYHFWASPVSDPLQASLNAASSGNSTLNLSGKNNETGLGGGLFTPSNVISSDPASYNPAPIYNGIASDPSNPVRIANYWLNKYTMGEDYSGWNQIKETGQLNPGEGFTMKGVGEGTGTVQRYDFRGRPNNGTIKVAVSANQNTLVGNPYPSAMDLDFYLLSNAGADVSACKDGATAVGNRITGIAYFWESDPQTKSHYLEDYKGGYGTYSPVSCSEAGTYARPTFSKYGRDGEPTTTGANPMTAAPARRYAPIGQGFFVVGSENLTGTNYVEAHNEFRVFQKENAETSTFKSAERKGKSTLETANHKEATELNGISEMRLMVGINDTYMRELVAAFSESATTGFDRAADGENISFLSTDISYHFPGSDVPYNINILPFDADEELPLTISAGGKTNSYSIHVSALNQDVPGVWIYDKKMGEYHDILNATYDLALAEGIYNERFSVVFKDNSEDLGIAEEIKTSFDVVQNNKIAQLRVFNPRAVILKEIAVFDISGKQVAGKLNEGTSDEVVISSANWSDGIYIVRVVTRDNIEFTKKVQVANSN